MSTKDTTKEYSMIKILGGVSITTIICLTICFLVSNGFNTYIKLINNKKEIEVQATNLNSNSVSND